MKKYLSLLMIATLFVSCQQKKQEATTEEDASNEIASEVVSNLPLLTEQQKADRWKILFDGKTMEGWRTYKGKENNSWEVIDGTLHCKPFIADKTEKRSDIMTVDQYESFELTFDFKISEQGNSGVIFHATEEFDQPYASGPEYQIVDDIGYPGDVLEVRLTGANFDMQATTTKNLNPAGEWNQGKLLVKNNHVEHWLNGDKILEYNLHSPAWKTLVAKSKWKDFPGYGQSKKGYIDLQDHSNEVWFKNILIKVF